MFANVSAPRHPNWNPPDSIQKQKSGYLKNLPPLTQKLIDFGDLLYQQRLEALQGIDEIVEDFLSTLDAKGVLNNTYGMCLVPRASKDRLTSLSETGPSTCADQKGQMQTDKRMTNKTPIRTQSSTRPTTDGILVCTVRLQERRSPTLTTPTCPLSCAAPTYPRASSRSSHPRTSTSCLPCSTSPALPRPTCRSLLPQWQQPNQSYGCGTGVGRDILNVGFWGSGLVEAPTASGNSLSSNANNSYKSLCLVGEEHSWLLIKWCTNEVELYNTRDDPYELTNLALGANGTDGGAAITNPDVKRMLTRLNAILLVTKSCTLGTCRDPWTVLQPPPAASPVRSLKQALDPSHDDFYSDLPEVKFGKCMMYQDVANEEPYYPPGAAEAITRFRKPTDNHVSLQTTKKLTQDLSVFYGGPEQRHASWAEIAGASRELTDEELEQHIDKRDFAEIPVLEWWN